MLGSEHYFKWYLTSKKVGVRKNIGVLANHQYIYLTFWNSHTWGLGIIHFRKRKKHLRFCSRDSLVPQGPCDDACTPFWLEAATGTTVTTVAQEVAKSEFQSSTRVKWSIKSHTAKTQDLVWGRLFGCGWTYPLSNQSCETTRWLSGW